MTTLNGVEVDSSRSAIPFKLAGDRVLIKRIPPDEYTDEKKTLRKPLNYVEPFMTGYIKCLGGGEYGTAIPQSLKVDLIVCYWHQSAIDVNVDGEKYDMVRVSDVWGIP